MSRAATIRKRAEQQHIVVTCTSGNEYEIGKASPYALALMGELAVPKGLADSVLAPPGPVETDEVKEAKAKAEADKPDWMKNPNLRAELERVIGQSRGISGFLRAHVYDPQILPDSEPITDPDSQVHECDIADDMAELIGYISQYSGGAEVEALKPFPGRRVSDSAGPDGEAVRAEAVEPDGAGAEPVREPAL